VQQKLSLTWRIDHNGENPYKQKLHLMNFKSPLPKNPLIKNQAVTSTKNLTLTGLSQSTFLQ